MELSFIGLGAMGVPMLDHLVRDEATVSHIYVHNRTRARCEEWVASLPGEELRARVTICDSPAAALEAQAVGPSAPFRIVCSIVSNDAALDEVCSSLGAVLAPQDIHLCLSTVSPEIMDKQAALSLEKGAYFVACPVFGRPPVVVARKLFSVPSGDASAVDRCRPILQVFSQKIVYGGAKCSNSAILKLSGNFCILSFIQMSAEYLALAESHGIDRSVAYELLSSPSGVFANLPILATYGKLVEQQQYTPVGFSALNGLKDAGLICDAAAAGGVEGAVIMGAVRERRGGEGKRKRSLCAAFVFLVYV